MPGVRPTAFSDDRGRYVCLLFRIEDLLLYVFTRTAWRRATTQFLRSHKAGLLSLDRSPRGDHEAAEGGAVSSRDTGCPAVRLAEIDCLRPPWGRSWTGCNWWRPGSLLLLPFVPVQWSTVLAQ